MSNTQPKIPIFLFSGLIGFVIGLVTAGVLAVWIYSASSFRPESMQARLEPLTPKVKPIPKAPDDPKSEAARILPPEAVKTTSKSSAAASTAGGDSVAKPTTVIKAISPEPSPSAEPRARLWLQVGAYSSVQDANGQRARFAMLGYEAQVQQGDAGGDKGSVFRVRIGPYRDPDEAGRVRADLAQQGIEVSVVK